MRIVNVRREFSERILLEDEGKVLEQIPKSRTVIVDGEIRRRKNPYREEFLKARYAIYKDSLRGDPSSATAQIDADDYTAKVTYWYRSHGYIDNKGHIDVWKAIRDYEADAKERDPDADWFNYPSGLKKKGKSHHPTTIQGRLRERKKERERRAEYRRKKLGL